MVPGARVSFFMSVFTPIFDEIRRYRILQSFIKKFKQISVRIFVVDATRAERFIDLRQFIVIIIVIVCSTNILVCHLSS